MKRRIILALSTSLLVLTLPLRAPAGRQIKGGVEECRSPANSANNSETHCTCYTR